MLADKLMKTLDYWGISKSKVLMVITDNGSNLVKALRLAKLMKEDTEAKDNDEREDEEDEEEGEEEDDCEEEEDIAQDDAEDDYAIEGTLNFPRFPCIANSLQLVVRELTKSQAYV